MKENLKNLHELKNYTLYELKNYMSRNYMS